MGDSANVVYGRLKEAAHISGYTFGRTSEWLETLLADDAWRTVGSGFDDVNVFLRSIDLSPFNIGDTRPGLVRRIKALQPAVSNRAIAEAAGVDEKTVRNDLRPAADNSAAKPGNPTPDQQEDVPAADNSAAPLQEEEQEGQDAIHALIEGEPEPEPDAKSAAHVSQNAGDNEWYTPAEYIAAARAVMGTIDLDPASSDEANGIIRAYSYYTAKQNGLTQPWEGRVWLNPPYAQPLVDRFCSRLAREYQAGNVTDACALVNNATETAWFQGLAAQATAMCFPRARVRFWHPDKKSAPLQGQAVIYMGEAVDRFRTEFVRFGFVVKR